MIFKLAAIFYFSGTGNTWWVAREIARQLMNQYGFDCPIYSIELKSLWDTQNLINLLWDKGTIGIGYPIYGSDVPSIMQQFLRQFPNMEKFPNCEKEMFIFDTQFIFSGDGVYVPKKMMEIKGYKVKWTTHFNMPNNICIPMSPFPYTRTETQIQKKLDQTIYRITKLVQNINKNRPSFMGRNLFARFAGWSQRLGFKFEYPTFIKKIAVVADRCNKCGYCATNCPTGNIQMGESGPQFGNKCILCVRCYNFCPTVAIKFGKKPHPMEKIPLYHGPIAEFKPEMCHDP